MNDTLHDLPEAIVIDKKIIFKPKRQYIRNIESGLIENLSPTSSMLLLYLLKNGERPSLRTSILNDVFRQSGARPTEANLNQHISFVRKSLFQSGLTSPLIETIPKIGFKVTSDDISFRMLPFETESPPDKIKWDFSQKLRMESDIRHIVYKSIFLIIVLLITIGAPIIMNNRKITFHDVNIQHTFMYKKCTVHAISGDKNNRQPNSVIESDFLKFSYIPECNAPRVAYIFSYSVNSKQLKWNFVSVCDKENGLNNCNSYYQHEEN